MESELIQALNEGGEWNTWAHWQIGLAYAKYLSPEFHMWCNEVIRDRMEGKSLPVQATSTLLTADIEKIAEICAVVTRPIFGELINYAQPSPRA